MHRLFCVNFFVILCGNNWFMYSGYSKKVDALRQDIQNNEEQLTLFIASLHSSHPGLPKMTIVSHKGYIRVLEVTKSQSSKMEKCPELIRFETFCFFLRKFILNNYRIDGTQSKVRFRWAVLAGSLGNQFLCPLPAIYSYRNLMQNCNGLNIPTPLLRASFSRAFVRTYV